ncbi:MFS transporter [Dictyobacter alpinus]|uniref:MFS transporter n=1 Tax=Dictyobacter alpinus TaxID=2014873 RepID=A0A402B9I3_9CHLR|nr:MFS transporter [Dictyobacter alpinus]GCE28063.1 MFS transporter [Dictyobacter alpinus]
MSESRLTDESTTSPAESLPPEAQVSASKLAENQSPQVAESLHTTDVGENQPPRVSLGFQLLLSLANMAMWLAIIPLQQILQPLQVSIIDPVNKVSGLSFVLAVTGITSVIAQPVVGALSDRTTFRLGRRRTWILVGMIFSVLLLLLQANAPSILILAIEAGIYGFAIGMIMTPVLTIIPDRVPLSQRATASAFVGLAQPIGIVVGSILIAVIIKSVQGSYYAIAGILFVAVALFLFFVREEPVAKTDLPAFNLKDYLISFFEPLKERDFTLTWVGRFLIIFAQILLLEFMLYYLKDVIHYERLFPGQTAEQGVSMFQVINTVFVVISTLASGIISDKLQRRKPFVIAAGLIMTIALLLIAFTQSWILVLVTAAIFGIGFGIFLSADVALATQVLPKNHNLGKDLGLITAANTLPQLFIPLVSFLAFNVLQGYPALFSIAAVFTILGALAIIPIRSVR